MAVLLICALIGWAERAGHFVTPFALTLSNETLANNERQRRWFLCVWVKATGASYWAFDSSRIATIVLTMQFECLQARCLAGVHSESDTSQFLVGTTGPKNDNHLHLLDFDDSAITVHPTLYRHEREIWDIATCPFNEHRFFTTYTNDGMRILCWSRCWADKY